MRSGEKRAREKSRRGGEGEVGGGALRQAPERHPGLASRGAKAGHLMSRRMAGRRR